jgi:hypothetical protein
MSVELSCARGLAFGERRIGGRQQVLLLAADLALGDTLEEGEDLAFRQVAHEAVDRLAVDEGENGRKRLDAELPRDCRMLVGIQFDQLDCPWRP